ncbi:hypothetical protein [Streptomyces fimbriatus]|uniref:SDR family NAD(P)-dependent oxidoreductase n=1 Tax=Streptomyces fimbriatus TaxID=68197 RepID=A0ABW0D8B7_STRFI
MNKVWLITGASSGFGRAIAEAALADGDVVVGAVRRPGDPAKAAALVLAALEAEDTPLRLPLGDDGVSAVLGHLDQVREEVLAWEKRARATGFDD